MLTVHGNCYLFTRAAGRRGLYGGRDDATGHGGGCCCRVGSSASSTAGRFFLVVVGSIGTAVSIQYGRSLVPYPDLDLEPDALGPVLMLGAGAGLASLVVVVVMVVVAAVIV